MHTSPQVTPNMSVLVEISLWNGDPSNSSWLLNVCRITNMLPLKTKCGRATCEHVHIAFFSITLCSRKAWNECRFCNSTWTQFWWILCPFQTIYSWIFLVSMNSLNFDPIILNKNRTSVKIWKFQWPIFIGRQSNGNRENSYSSWSPSGS